MRFSNMDAMTPMPPYSDLVVRTLAPQVVLSRGGGDLCSDQRT